MMAPLSVAQIEVIDPTPDESGYQGSNRSTVATPVPAPASPPITVAPAPQEAATSTSEVFYQLQLMQEEILQMRGVVEQQQHDIAQLKQQRMDDLISLDKRLGALGNAAASAPAPAPDRTSASAASPKTAAATETAPPANPPQDVSDGGEDQAYNDAYARVRERDFKGATDGFLRYLERYPQGAMVPNASYWLGELYLLDGKHNEAKARFEVLPNQYPEHRKVPDAIFKLARLHDLQGEREKSKALLNKLISQYGNSSAAAKARKYLQENP